ncbi:plasmid replication initiator TrfA [Burkholderia sp. B21-005]|uniref:plasmid replication initiator TrfA n=1 Tax=Burkholderia sp. B21-005 TaxID=2890406 RepID=UPI001E5830F5|nr:plasmid replication initiator TrfA [Burkholderia sp. B21-005]UEP40680.1 plasmid-related transcriptional repressor protein [Burkholderia sp. B21-005]
MSGADASVDAHIPDNRGIGAALALVRRLEAERLTRADAPTEKRSPQQLFLPGMDDFMRAMPNHIARSSLFAPVARGRKTMHKDTVLVSRSDAVIKFWGEQLDEAQADVWMQAMHEASKHPLGEPVAIRRAAFLRSIGRHVGNYEYKWLHRAMEALTFAMLVIEVTKDGAPKLEIGKSRALHLIDGFDFDVESETYMLRVDPRWQAMFANREFALIDWDKRLRIDPRQDMAKALQRLAATSDETIQRYALDWLKRKLEYTGRPRDFVDALKRAMRELERHDVGIIAGGRIETSTKGKLQAVWTKI